MRYQLLIFSFAICTIAVATEEDRPVFVLVGPCLAVATLETASELKESVWSSAESAWVPNVDQINEGLDYLKTPDGRQTIAMTAGEGIDMLPWLEQWEQKRFQIYGLISHGERYIYFDAIPLLTAPERKDPTLWLKRSISQSTADGGAAFWSYLYNYDQRKPIRSHRRPGS